MITLYGFTSPAETKAAVVALDVRGSDVDFFPLDPPTLPAPITAFVLSLPIEPDEAGGWSTFRRYVQNVLVGGQVTLEVTPIPDGSESSALTQSVTLNAGVDGANPTKTVPLAARGTSHQIKVAVTSKAGQVALGDAEFWIVPRRSQR